MKLSHITCQEENHEPYNLPENNVNTNLEETKREITK